MVDQEVLKNKTDKIIREKFKLLCMNDSKWVRLLDELSETEGLIRETHVKLVWSDEIYSMWIESASYQFDYYDHAMEAMIRGTKFGWHDYKEIEWIEFPLKAEVLKSVNNLKADTHIVDQDIAQIERITRSIGELELQVNGESLRIYGYN